MDKIRLSKIGTDTVVEVEMGGEWIEVLRDRGDRFCRTIERNEIAEKYYATSEI